MENDLELKLEIKCESPATLLTIQRSLNFTSSLKIYKHKPPKGGGGIQKDEPWDSGNDGSRPSWIHPRMRATQAESIQKPAVRLGPLRKGRITINVRTCKKLETNCGPVRTQSNDEVRKPGVARGPQVGESPTLLIDPVGKNGL